MLDTMQQHGSGFVDGMMRPISNRLIAVTLAIATLGVVLLATLNLSQERRFERPSDGVWWLESGSELQAERVLAGSPAERAGIKQGDLLTAVNDHEIHRVADLTREMFATGVYGKAVYSLERRGISLDVPLILEASDRSINPGLRMIAAIYLMIGLYVLLRRWTAPRSTHFYIFCLVSFVLYSFKYTGKLDELDLMIYWGNILASALQPALLLHFAFTFPEDRPSLRGRAWGMPVVYVPAVLLVGLQATAFLFWSATGRLLHALEQLGTGYQAIYYLLAAFLLLRSYLKAVEPLQRQQLKWLTSGAMMAVLPYTIFSAIPFLLDLPVPSLLTKIAGISLVFLPLTFSWAIVRYRLMDTDLILKRGVTYTLATTAIVGVFYGLVALFAEIVHTRLPQAREWGLVAAIILSAQLFDPVKRRIQEWVDRLFDRRRYDYRKALIEFGSGLSSQTDLRALMHSLVDRLPRTLLVSRVAVFLPDETGRLRLGDAHGLAVETTSDATPLELSFLNFGAPRFAAHIFFENPQQVPHLTVAQQQTAALLDLNYYLPCRVQDRTIAVIGLGRTTGGDFLSSEDVELLESLASYIGIALQNAQLYASLEEKAREYERLKEFNENIVESINVGILAVDLEDHIESWNTQMEALFALSRSEVLGKRIAEVFPKSFSDEFDRVRFDSGVHNLYKYRLTTPAGEIRTINAAIAPLLSRDFAVLGRIILVDDITDRVELESQLTQAEKLSSIGLLAAGVAHEVNTPLAVISSYTQMLSKQLRGDDRLSPLLEKITKETFRASEIVNGLLNFSRTSGTEFREVDLNAIIHDTLTLLDHQFKSSRVQLDSDLQADLPRILGNPGKLQQVFLNLFLNAKDAMTEGGTIKVTTSAGDHVDVVIRDSGAGIAPEHVKKIYDPFFTTKTAPAPGERRGTGLGLAITYGIIQEHAAKIQVTSEVGVGTTFQLEFPMVRKPIHV